MLSLFSVATTQPSRDLHSTFSTETVKSGHSLRAKFGKTSTKHCNCFSNTDLLKEHALLLVVQ